MIFWRARSLSRRRNESWLEYLTYLICRQTEKRNIIENSRVQLYNKQDEHIHFRQYTISILSVIGPENFRFSLNQSDAQLTKISTWLPAIFWLIYAVCLSFPWVLIGSLRYFGFTTLNRKELLYLQMINRWFIKSDFFFSVTNTQLIIMLRLRYIVRKWINKVFFWKAFVLEEDFYLLKRVLRVS